ncbi:hypothetical protein F5J12DRAFT_894976 [Pisolithus orientalis]|uniref:uncharacterized protein n=1 Tax=Pisolithus orientalis TaxID=936130 RepID=UPI0022241E5A|nr:uncharacterized protein F5J12DRAFT_894976 [Pisolithus orientalis]KAI6000216.1 hypothetical protein F5J12DRAFT_894976 [Pisolithus orientalis]
MLFFHISPCLEYLQATVKLLLDELLDLCNEEMPSTPSALDANATTKCTGSNDVIMQNPPGAYMHSYIQGPSPFISKTGATPTPGPSATSTSAMVTNSSTSAGVITQTNPSAGITHTKPGPSMMAGTTLTTTTAEDNDSNNSC